MDVEFRPNRTNVKADNGETIEFPWKQLSGSWHTNTEKSHGLRCAPRVLQIYICEKSKCLGLVVSVFQWIKHVLMKKHLFMTSGTNRDRTARRALDCGIITAGLDKKAMRAFF